ncbi:zinc ribbon domain-containing protein [Pseudomonas sp. CFBP 8772]|uniref:zinc ribbon domain-containing protein n=1 Tax=Pseudomonas sp. CFBP 8772 TaxID=2775284 RepID=UPI001783F3C1|nr:zinc ribbon domain-containing protein [Pseudomonas sp. CFBP 8772]MBD8600980.1 zinc ribbon domain-containing protein [Pseudomonas sp. CFBP 8772]
MATTTPLVLYVYHCAKCGQNGQLHLEETAHELTAACSMCGAEVLAEWGGGVELATDLPE